MQSTPTNKFITIEGIEGVGKSTAMKFIQEYFQQHQQECLLTREPGGTPVAEKIRQILLTPTTEEIITSETELLLMFASRAQHIANVIEPALQAGKWVISDRFVDASYAYQGGGRKIPLAQIESLDAWVVRNVRPQVTILLDCPPEIGLARAKHRGQQDRIEQEKVDFFTRVREVYLSCAKKFPERFCLIDASQPLSVVQAELKNILDQLLSNERGA